MEYKLVFLLVAAFLFQVSKFCFVRVQLHGHFLFLYLGLTFILLTWTIWRAPTNASKWRMRFNSAFKGLI
jgi:hypothetical protein